MNPLDLIRWTTANARARADYYARPTRACRRDGCDFLAVNRVCEMHERDKEQFGVRQKRRRAAA